MTRKPPMNGFSTISRNDGIVAAIGALVLLLGTATGNAFAVLATAIVAFALIAIFQPQKLRHTVLLAMTVAASKATAVAIAITKLNDEMPLTRILQTATCRLAFVS